MRRVLLLLVTLAVVAITTILLSTRHISERPHPTSANGRPQSVATKPSAPVRPDRKDFVGSQSCASCHKVQTDAYLQSHHAKALAKPSPALTKTRFDGSHFATKHGGNTKFSLRHGEPVVTSTTADRKSATFPIRYVSGVWPLEQYVVTTERGKLQALGVVWDSRPQAQGGEHWLHVYGRDGIAPRDPLFFTSAAQNWNHMCAECHSTWVERRYDARSDSFDTQWAELSVGCEGCHGPGAAHVASATAGDKAIVRLPARLQASALWRPAGTGSPVPHVQDGVEVEVCAPCHSRREPLKEGFLASDPFLDSFAPELLLPGRYHADGQVEGEVYEWGSFLQSRMYQAGVRCSDCHEPHSGKPYAEGNKLCVRCHEPARFDREAHSHHAAGKAPLCVDCHMPPATFMQIDERRDHSIRIPRPDHSVAHGTPNACNGCHVKESANWARDHVVRWDPKFSERPHFGEALAKDRKGALDAPSALRKAAANGTFPAIARATALERMSHYPTQKTVQSLQAALQDKDALVAYGAVLGCAQLPLEQRAALLLPAVSHPARAVRIAAAQLLAAIPLNHLPEAQRAALERAFVEVTQSFAVSASRAETHIEQGAFELARGHVVEAEAALRAALRLQPCLPEAHLNLADLARAQRNEAEAERAIRAALACDGNNAAAHHALGLWQVRTHQPREAIASLEKAVALAPDDTRFSYVLAVALNGQGQRARAIALLDTTLKRRPNELSTLKALVGFLREDGQGERANEAARMLEMVQSD